MTLEEQLAKAVESALAQQQAVVTENTVSKAEIDAKFEALKGEMSTLIADAVAKAMPADRQGVGRVGTLETPAVTFENDPIAYMVAKAASIKSEAEYSVDERAFIGGLWQALMLDGMKE